MYSDNDFRLYHHGVLGQKWGEQNGPPYPLDSSVSTGKSLRKQKKERKRLVKDIKKLAKKHGRYSQEVQDRVNKDLTDDQRARVREVNDRFSKRINSIDDKLEKKRTDAIVKETDRLVEDEIRRNPTAYKSERDIRKLREAYSDLAEDNVFEKNPNLFLDMTLDKAFDEYNEDLREIGRDILKEYSDVPIKIPNSWRSNADELVAFALDRIDYQQRQKEKEQQSYYSEQKKYFNENKSQLLSNAKKNNKFDLEFLEITQNDYDDMSESQANQKILKDYEKYLDDPEGFVKRH